MRRFALLAVILLASPCEAASPDSAPLGRFDCDVSGEDEPPIWKKELPALPALISGTFEMLERRSHHQWPPMVQVYIDNGDSHSKGFSVDWRPEESGGPSIHWFPDWDVEGTAGAGSPWRASGVIPFEIVVLADGQVRFRADNVIHAAWVDSTQPLTLQLTCVTSRVRFDSIAVRSVSPDTSMPENEEGLSDAVVTNDSPGREPDA